MESRTPGNAGIQQTGVTSELHWLDGPEDGRLSRLVRHGRLIAAGLLCVLLALRILDVAPLQVLRLWGSGRAAARSRRCCSSASSRSSVRAASSVSSRCMRRSTAASGSPSRWDPKMSEGRRAEGVG